jgi:hypothetical protein
MFSYSPTVPPTSMIATSALAVFARFDAADHLKRHIRHHLHVFTFVLEIALARITS